MTVAEVKKSIDVNAPDQIQHSWNELFFGGFLFEITFVLFFFIQHYSVCYYNTLSEYSCCNSKYSFKNNLASAKTRCRSVLVCGVSMHITFGRCYRCNRSHISQRCMYVFLICAIHCFMTKYLQNSCHSQQPQLDFVLIGFVSLLTHSNMLNIILTIRSAS